MSVTAVATSAHCSVTSRSSAGSVNRSVVFTSADHLLRYYCICHSYCSECCSSAVLLTV